MAKSSFLACLALLAISVLPTRATAAAGEYHWARGILRASSASAITLQLKDGSLTLRVDQATEVISPTPIDASTGRGLIPNLGSLVQVHFSESRGERVAALVVAEGAQLPLTPVKDLGQSVLGEAKRFQSRTVVVGIDSHTRDVSLNDDTQLVDRNGSVRAVGTKAIKAALVAGTKVLVTWKPFWVMDGSGIINQYYLDAETIRMITVSPLDEKNALTVR
jgi:hypothetical protein